MIARKHMLHDVNPCQKRTCPLRACSNGPATPAAQYTYYLAAALLAGNDGAKKKYLWWGRYLTMFQMFQVCQTSRLTIHKLPWTWKKVASLKKRVLGTVCHHDGPGRLHQPPQPLPSLPLAPAVLLHADAARPVRALLRMQVCAWRPSAQGPC